VANLFKALRNATCLHERGKALSWKRLLKPQNVIQISIELPLSKAKGGLFLWEEMLIVGENSGME
jgi:hypothetical protein